MILGFALFSGLAAAASPVGSVAAGATLEAQVLAVHNRHRRDLGLAPLRWSAGLAQSARGYGPQLARVGRLTHSARATRPGQSENLWMGTHGAYSVRNMVEYWADERRAFRAGMFPHVSATSNWLDVSHYTQMIWPATTHVGCHLEQTARRDYLICRYSPKGNRDGQAVGRTSFASNQIRAGLGRSK